MDFLEIIDRAIAEHRVVRSNLSVMGGAMNDLEATFSLQKAHASWAQGSVDTLVENVDRLRQTVEQLGAGINRHFGFEEQYLPPVFGGTLMKALIFEHNEVRKRLADCRALIATDIMGLPQEKLLVYRSDIQQKLSDLTQTMEGHASREETVYFMLERALKAEKEGKAA